MGQILLRQFRGLTVLSIIIGTGALAPGDEAAPELDETAIIQGVLEQIAAQQEEIFSASIRYRWHIASYRNPANTPERVHQLLNEYDLSGDPDSLRELVHTLVPQPATIDPPWELRTFQMLGDQRRADSSHFQVIQLVDHEHEMRYENNQQLSVDQRGRSRLHYPEIADFRSSPPPPRHGLQAEDLRISSQDDGQMTLEMRLAPDAGSGQIPTRFTFDRATGVMTHYASYNSFGWLSEEIWQQALTEYPGGVVLPAVRIAASYESGVLSALRVHIIEEAELNGPVAEETFILPVAAGTVVVDERFPKVRVQKTREAVPDVRALLAPLTSPLARVETASAPGWRLLLILNGAALIAIATILWRKSALPRSEPNQGSSDS